MKPGATTRPAASMRRVAVAPVEAPTAAMRSPTTQTSARNQGAPVPSTTRPPAKSRSQPAGCRADTPSGGGEGQGGDGEAAGHGGADRTDPAGYRKGLAGATTPFAIVP